MNSCVLDASALLAVINGETGWEKVLSQLPHAAISSVNLSEVAAKLAEREELPIDNIRSRLSQYELSVVEFDEQLAFAAAALRPLTRHLGLSLGDRACLATAARQKLPAMTAEREWKKLKLGIAIELIR